MKNTAESSPGEPAPDEREMRHPGELLRLWTAQEHERTQLARELHDQFGAALTALKLELHSIIARLPPGFPILQEKAKGMSDLIDHTVKSVVKMESMLRPRILEDFGLVAAVEWEASDFQRRTGIPCQAKLPERINLDPKLSIALFRIVQEALTNVGRHAQATEATIQLRKDDNQVVLEIKDNGVGITQQNIANETSFGLLSMRERAYALGGQVRFRGGSGTTVTVEIPINPI